MHIKIELPAPKDVRTALGDYLLNYFFTGSPSTQYQLNALATTYMRLAAGAVDEYNFGAAALQAFYRPDGGAGILSAQRAIFHFETCISTIHRAILAFDSLLMKETSDGFTKHARALPEFVSKPMAKRFRHARHTIQHLEDRFLKGVLHEGDPIALKPDGPEVDHPGEPGQTVKTIDRFVIGKHVISVAEVVSTLNTLTGAAAHLAGYIRDDLRTGSHGTLQSLPPEPA